MTYAIEAGFAAVEELGNPAMHEMEVPNAVWAGEIIVSQCISYAQNKEDLLDGVNISGVHGMAMTAEQMYQRGAAVVMAAASLGIQVNYWSIRLPEKATSLEACAEAEAAKARAIYEATDERVILDGFSMGGGIVSGAAEMLENQGVVAVVNATTSPFVPINRPVKALKKIPKELADIPYWGEPEMLEPMSEMLVQMGGHILRQVVPTTPSRAADRLMKLGRHLSLGVNVARTSNANSIAKVSRYSDVVTRVSHGSRDPLVDLEENQKALRNAGYKQEMAVIHTGHVAAVVHPQEIRALTNFVISLAGRDEPPLTPVEQETAQAA